jgi:hypothetical protein
MRERNRTTKDSDIERERKRMMVRQTRKRDVQRAR